MEKLKTWWRGSVSLGKAKVRLGVEGEDKEGKTWWRGSEVRSHGEDGQRSWRRGSEVMVKMVRGHGEEGQKSW